MPLTKSYTKPILLEKDHNNQVSIHAFTGILFHTGISCYPKALSSKRQRKKVNKGASYDTYPNGSITLEMVVILPLFVSFMVFFLFLFRVLLVQESMEEALVYTSRTLAVACYGESEGEQGTQAKLLAGAQLAFRKGLKDNDCPINFIRGGAAGISLLESQFTGDEIILRASYEMRAPCVLLGDYSYHMVQCVQSRKWIGNTSLTQGHDADEQWVFITPHGTVYHSSRTCRYLDLTIRAVSRRSLVTLRNADRGIYHACEYCAAGGNKTVYVTDYGERYHSSLSCKGLKRTIYMVKLSQVGGRHLCSKCAVRQ